MKIKDPIYGKFEIEEPVIKELLKSEGFTRLKYISQSGLKHFNISSGTSYSRWEHSIGVMLLLRKLNASLNEQIAGLLHDVSHTVFSHVIDFVFNTQKHENYAGEKLKEFLENSDIGKILKHYNIDLDLMGDYEAHNQFGLLERPIPELCADRIDNGLRYMLYSGINMKGCADNLTVKNNHIIFKSKQPAKKFAEGYLTGTKNDWGNAERGLRAHFLSEAIKRSLKIGIVDLKQFHTETEKSIIKILKDSKDSEILENLKRVDGKIKFVFDRNGKIHIKEKVRYVDPEIMEKGRVKKLTEIDAKYKKAVYEEKRVLKKGYRINLVT